MKETNNEVNNNSLSDIFTKTEDFFERNNKKLLWVVACIVVVVVAVYAVRHFYSNPRRVTAAEELFVAQNRFDNSEFDLALNGDETTLGFLDIIDQYGSTPSGNLARYYAAICQLNLGQYAEALDNLDHYKGRDLYTAAEAEMLRGDAEAELENYEAALKRYQKAAKIHANIVTTPMATYKAALILVDMGRSDEARTSLQAVRTKYPNSPLSADIDKLIGYTEGK